MNRRDVAALTASRIEKVYRALVSAAENGKSCPSNDVLATIAEIGLSGASGLLSNLERQGRISVQRFQSSRIVTITATGRKTAGAPGAPHWRTRDPKDLNPERFAQRGKGRRYVQTTPVEILGTYVSRDPCPRCGVRSDIGCKHSKNPIGTSFGSPA